MAQAAWPLIAALLTSWSPSGLVYEQRRLPVTFCITPNATNTFAAPADIEAATRAGIEAWNSMGVGGTIACTNFSTTPDPLACRPTIDITDGRLQVFWNRNWVHGSGTIGATWSSGNGIPCGAVDDDTGQTTTLACKRDSDIELNDVDFNWTVAGGGTDVSTAVGHEFGHALGLDHCDDNGTCSITEALMYSSYLVGVMTTPQPDDVEGVCALYPGDPGGVGWPCEEDGDCDDECTPDGYCTTACGSCPPAYPCLAGRCLLEGTDAGVADIGGVDMGFVVDTGPVDAGPPPDRFVPDISPGRPIGGSGGRVTDVPPESGCGCAAGGSSGSPSLFLLVLLFSWIRRSSAPRSP